MSQHFLEQASFEEIPSLFDEIPSLLWRAGPDAKRSFFNRAWLTFTGRSLAIEMGDGWLEGVHPDDRERVIDCFRQAFSARQPVELEFRLGHHSGEYRWILDSSRPYQNREGEFAGYIGSCYDLTDRKNMEEALRERERMVESLFEFAPDAILAINSAGRILHANRQAQALLGYDRQELDELSIEKLAPERLLTQYRQQFTEYYLSPKTLFVGDDVNLHARRKDGSEFPVELTLGPLQMNGEPLVLAAVRDISGRKRAEQDLREREQFISTAVTAAPIVFFKIDSEGVIRLSLGRSLSRLQDGSDPIGRSVYEAYRDTPQVIENFRRALAGESFTTFVEAGGYSFATSYSPGRDEAGEINGVIGVAVDITQHRLMERALQKSEARFHSIFEEASLGIKLVDLQGMIVESNPALQEMLGYSAQELRQMSFNEITHPADLEDSRKLLQQLVEGQISSYRAEKRYIRKDGEILWGQLAMSLIREEGHPQYAIGLVENITAQKVMEAELAEVQRRLMDSREEERLHLAQELHDGPLQDLHGMIFAINALQMGESDPERLVQIGELQGLLQNVIGALRATCGELRPPALVPFGLEKAIRSHAEGIAETHPELELKLDLTSDGLALPERVRLALFRIYQNLLMNVLRHSQASQVSIHFKLDEESVTLEIEDNGRGFEVPRRWVDLVRQGHFGLVGAVERAEAIGGLLKIKSRLGAGTHITVTVPRGEEWQGTPSRRYATMLVAKV